MADSEFLPFYNPFLGITAHEYGFSENQRLCFDMIETKRVLCYQPQDDSYALAHYHYITWVRKLRNRIFRWLACRVRGRPAHEIKYKLSTKRVAHNIR